jgi:putative protease
MRYTELLSPARNLECGIAAVEHGADAVYIGAPRFGARAAAGNSVEDIQKLCDYAHQFGVKIYVTLNTLLRPEELEQARLIAWDLYHAGADAFITQDEALLRLALPPVPLHASTQMDNRTKEDVARLKELGFNQVVLARELSLEQIREIHEAVPEVTLEAFVHGALCVSYSGRCYASEYCFGRSANRGECAQFCRLPFSLEDANGNTLIKDKYLLSLKDMNRQQHLEEMMDAGVRSFKIEGRLKDVAYVKNVTASYREALDAIMKRRPEFARSSYGTSTYTFHPDLSRSFSRGYTDYFLFGRTNDLASPETPKSMGREVGRVKEVRRDCIIVSSTDVFSNGDGLCFFDGEGKLQGFRANRAEGNHLYPASMPNIRKGDRLWRSFDKKWEDLMSGKTAERRIPARFLFEETERGFRLSFSAEGGSQKSEEFTLEHQLARTDQTSSIKEVLSKLGDTPYICQDIEIRFSQPWFIPRSMLAEWRRRIIENSKLKIENPIHKDIQPTTSNPQSSNSNLQSSISNLQSSNSNLQSPNSNLQSSFFNPQSPLMTCRFCLRHAWGQCKKEKPAANEMVNGKWLDGKWQDPLYLVLGDGRRFRLEFDCKRCEMKLLAPDKA